MIRAMRVVGPAALAAVLVSCDGPKGGELVAELNAPVEFGAVQFAIRTADPQAIDSVTAACAGCRVYMTRVSTVEVRGVLTGSIRSGPALRILVSDIEVPELYQVQLIQGAAADYRLLSLSGSSVRIPILP